MKTNANDQKNCRAYCIYEEYSADGDLSMAGRVLLTFTLGWSLVTPTAIKCFPLPNLTAETVMSALLDNV